MTRSARKWRRRLLRIARAFETGGLPEVFEDHPPFKLSFYEYQEIRGALAGSIGVIDAVEEAKPRNLNMAPMQQVRDNCRDALLTLSAARDRRERT